MKALIVGHGEIGKAIEQIEKEAGNYVEIQEIDNEAPLIEYDCMHICIPYNGSFNKTIEGYLEKYKSKLTICHSTTPQGTCENLGISHSPVIGVHPNLYEGIKTFIKFCNKKQGVDYLKSIGLNAEYMKDTEIAKILSTTYYGRNIMFAKMVSNLCKENGFDYKEIYERRNDNYNKGYKKLGKENVIRPVLREPDDKIGGHCVKENRDLLPMGMGAFMKQLYKSFYSL